MGTDGSRGAIVLLSGGLDSATALAIARRDGRECWALSFDYGQRHRHELLAAGLVARSLGAARHIVMPLDLRIFGGSSLTGAIPVPKDRAESEMGAGIPVTYVPARNLVFLSLASGLAEVAGAQEIYIGVNAVDYSGYPDCRPEFIRSFEETARLGTKAGAEGAGVRIIAPLVDLTKAQIIRLGARLSVDYSLTHSCYDPEVESMAPDRASQAVLACGRCDSCLIRARGFAEAGIPDPTRYARKS
ncbi:MAG: 7-cyano-7-deazaguanine synthase QueC [Phycisphaerales bacterium]|nr:7-cyano-7-deazaguanine synthase QueC [Phycisphaerales bacterium]